MRKTLGIALIALALGGCAKPATHAGVATAGGKASASPSASVPDMTDGERAIKFAQCMRDHGIDMPDPQTDGGGGVAINLSDGTDPKAVDAAMAQCKAYLPNGGTPPPMNPQQLEQARKFSQCMRDHGVANFPDPDADGRLTISGGPDSGMNPDDPTFKAALTACQQFQPLGKGGGTTTTHVGGKG